MYDDDDSDSGEDLPEEQTEELSAADLRRLRRISRGYSRDRWRERAVQLVGTVLPWLLWALLQHQSPDRPITPPPMMPTGTTIGAGSTLLPADDYSTGGAP